MFGPLRFESVPTPMELPSYRDVLVEENNCKDAIGRLSSLTDTYYYGYAQHTAFN